MGKLTVDLVVSAERDGVRRERTLLAGASLRRERVDKASGSGTYTTLVFDRVDIGMPLPLALLDRMVVRDGEAEHVGIFRVSEDSKGRETRTCVVSFVSDDAEWTCTWTARTMSGGLALTMSARRGATTIVSATDLADVLDLLG